SAAVVVPDQVVVEHHLGGCTARGQRGKSNCRDAQSQVSKSIVRSETHGASLVGAFDVPNQQRWRNRPTSAGLDGPRHGTRPNRREADRLEYAGGRQQREHLPGCTPRPWWPLPMAANPRDAPWRTRYRDMNTPEIPVNGG